MTVALFDPRQTMGTAPSMAPDSADRETWAVYLGGVPLTSDDSLPSPPRRWCQMGGWGARGTRTVLSERISSRAGATASGTAWKSLTFTVTANMLAAQDALYQFLDDLEQAVTLGPAPMSVDDPWGTWTRTVQLITAEQPVFGVNAVSQVFDLVAADPRRYGPPKSGRVSAFDTSVLGVKAEDPLPWVFAVIGSGSLPITNFGTIDAPVVFTVTGPAKNPSITLGGHTLSWNMTVAAGQQLVVDTDAHTATLGGGGDVRAYMIQRDWANAPVGLSSARYSAGSASAASSLTAQWADTRP